jgi:hypothetical protein
MMAKGRKEVTYESGLSGGFTQPKAIFASKHDNAEHIRAFQTACNPLGPKGHNLMENTPFGGFSASLHHPNHLAAVGRILDFGRLATIFAGLEYAELFKLQRFAAKRLGYASH